MAAPGAPKSVLANEVLGGRVRLAPRLGALSLCLQLLCNLLRRFAALYLVMLGNRFLFGNLCFFTTRLPSFGKLCRLGFGARLFLSLFLRLASILL
jgi:hypothetical protein